MALDIPGLEKTTDDELMKDMEFTGEMGDTLNHIASLMDEDFAKTPEGNEAAWLSMILEKFVDNDEDFISKFVSGNPGERGVDKMINELEHPDRRLAADKKLLEKIKKLSEDLKKKHIPDKEEWNFFRSKMKEFRELGPSGNLQEFHDRMNGLIKEIIERYPENKIADTLKERPKDKLPKLWALNNLKGEEVLVSYIIENILPDPRGFKDMQGFEQHLEGLLNMKPGNLRTEAGFKIFPEKEGDFPNWFGLQAAIQDKKKDHPLVKAAIRTGDKELVSIVLEKGQGRKDEFMQSILAFEKKLTSAEHISSVEQAATKEIAGLIHTELEKMKKDIDSERRQFANTIKNRIKDLRRSHSRNLAELAKRKEVLDELNKNTLLAANLAGSDYNSIHALDKDVDTYLIRVSDIMKIVRSRMIIFRHGAGKLNNAQAIAEFDTLVAEGPSEFALKAINQMKSVFENRISETVPESEYRSLMKNIDAFIDKMMEQLPVLATNLSRMTNRMVNLSTEFEDLQTEMDYYSKKAHREAMHTNRWVHKHVPYPRYREELDPEEYEFLDRAA